ncbi:hypothetical protein OKW28_008544 [Paraburkholderia sp. 40]
MQSQSNGDAHFIHAGQRTIGMIASFSLTMH